MVPQLLAIHCRRGLLHLASDDNGGYAVHDQHQRYYAQAQTHVGPGDGAEQWPVHTGAEQTYQPAVQQRRQRAIKSVHRSKLR